MRPFFLLLLFQLLTLSLILVAAVRQPSWRAGLLVGVALGACLGAGSQVALQRITPVTVLSLVGLDVLLLVQLRSLAIRPLPRRRSRDAWWC
jgi:hypothetical protein